MAVPPIRVRLDATVGTVTTAYTCCIDVAGQIQLVEFPGNYQSYPRARGG